MKILFLNYEYPPLGGGAANATHYLLREFKKNPDLEIDLITSSIDSKRHIVKFSSNIRIIRLPIGKDEKNLHFQKTIELFKYYFSAKKETLKVLKRKSYDVCLSFFTLPSGLIAYSQRKKIPYIVSLRGSDVPGYNPRFNLLYSLTKPLIKHIWREARIVLSNSKGLANLAKETDPNLDIKIIYNGVKLDQFFPKQEKSTNQKLKLLCVSRLTERKGIDFLLKAMAEMKKENITLTLVGEGDEKENLEKLTKQLGLEEKVQFMGIVPHQKLPQIYQKHDLFVLPSLAEGMSNTLLEAIASGMAVIVTDVGGSKELVDDGINGFTVQPESISELKIKIKKFIFNKNLTQIMGKKSRKKALNFSWQKIAEEYKKILKR